MKLNLYNKNYQLKLQKKTSFFFIDLVLIKAFLKKDIITNIVFKTRDKIKTTSIKKNKYNIKNFNLRFRYKKLLNKLVSNLTKNKPFLKKKLTKLCLNYFENLFFWFKNLDTITWSYCEYSPVLLGISSTNLKVQIKNLWNENKSNKLYNINFIFEKNLKILYLGVSFSYITNVFKGKRKIKNILLKPKYIFGFNKIKATLKHITIQIVKTQKKKQFLRLLDTTSIDNLTIKDTLNLNTRVNLSLANLLFDIKNSFFYKRKWAIFSKFYRLKAPMYF